MPNEPNPLQRGTVLVLGDPDNHMHEALAAAGFKPIHHDAPGTSIVGLVAVGSRAGLTPQERVIPIYEAARNHRATLAKGFVLVLTRQDGSHGLHTVRDAGFAALAGLGKSLKKEFPDAVVKVVDAHAECPDAARKAVAEITDGGRRTEVCYGRDGGRFIVEVAPQALPPGDPDLEGKALVVSGGAQGITVELLAALAPQKVKLLLLGRTELPGEASQWAALDEAGWKNAEAAMMAEMKARGEKVTPVTVQKAMSPRRKAADVHRNIQRLQDLGASVIYAPVDVQDARAVSEAVAFARSEFGAIHGVIHAAGIEISKDIASKDRAQFESVYNIKVQGWDALMAATRDDKLSVLMSFGSVAGRFGNIGQCDYAAANEYLAKAVKAEAAKRKSLIGTTIAWGPWGEVGMATKGSILQIMEATGVTPIPTADGVAQFLAELSQPGMRECVVAGALGAIDADKQVVSKGFDLATEIAERLVTERRSRYTLLDSVEAITPDQSIIASVVVDQNRDPALKDHKVDGVPYLPGVFGLEAFAQAASLIAPGDQVVLGADEVRFLLPLKQLKAAPQKGKVECRVLKTGPETRIQCRLTSQFHGPDGRPVGDPKLHFEAVLRFGTLAVIPKSAAATCDNQWSRGDIYPPFFHGPSFQVLDAAGPLSPDAVARYRAPTEPQFGSGPAEFHSYPMLLEALFQVSGLWAMQNEKAMGLPAGIRKVEITHAGPLPADVRLKSKNTGRDGQNQRTFDAEAASGDGRLLMRIQGFAMVEIGSSEGLGKSVPRSGLSSSAPPASSSTPASAPTPSATAASSKSTNGHHAPPTTATTVTGSTTTVRPTTAALPALPHLDNVALAVARVESLACSPTDFTPEEIATHAGFKVPKRAEEWRAGRLAAKRVAVETHPGFHLKDVEVKADGDGVPHLFLEGKKSGLHLSLTHRDGLAIAALSPQKVGIDLETIEDRAQSFLEEAFAVPELKTLLAAENPRVDVACLWSAKEAALKRAGVGLKSDLRQHVVKADDQGGAVVEGPATGKVGVRFFDVEGKVLAVSAVELDPAA